MDMKKNISITILLLAIVSITGCATLPVFMDRPSVANNIANKAGFIKEYIKADNFTLMTYQKLNKHSDSIRIYIEGDGRAWENKHKISLDPTPSNPVALKLAAVDPADNVAYIARPGQYSLSGLPECNSKYWSGSRFAPEVVESFNKAVDILKEKSGAKDVELVGYSGGGAIAVLVAARRSDVIALRTVAGNLNTKALSEYHHVSQLDGSMNPMDVAQKVAHIPQRHFVGLKDKVIPSIIAESFVKMKGDKDYTCITVVEGVSHNDGWDRSWKELLLMSLCAKNAPNLYRNNR
ncbi:MAG: alpha/beta hydrolase [Candidatus Omnitrophica bacterium]|nr:alpha/beta hydrolase [Candidatus Omnitrophota bacterium]